MGVAAEHQIVGTVPHVSGPWEDEYDEDGVLWQVQRCLYCDRVLRSFRYDASRTHPVGCQLGERVTTALPCTHEEAA